MFAFRMFAAVAVLALSSYAVSGAEAQENKDSAPLKPEIVAGDLVQARITVYSHVTDLKKKFAADPKSTQLTDGKKLYDQAYGAYSNWITTLHLAISADTVKNLRNDADYKAKTAAASKASGDFVKYVEAQVGGQKGFFAFASDAATIGIKIWNAVKDRHKQERLDFLAEFDKVVKWSDWDNVGAPAKESAPQAQ